MKRGSFFFFHDDVCHLIQSGTGAGTLVADGPLAVQDGDPEAQQPTRTRTSAGIEKIFAMALNDFHTRVSGRTWFQLFSSIDFLALVVRIFEEFLVFLSWWLFWLSSYDHGVKLVRNSRKWIPRRRSNSIKSAGDRIDQVCCSAIVVWLLEALLERGRDIFVISYIFLHVFLNSLALP